VLLLWDEPAVCATAKLVTSASTNNVASACFFIIKNSPGGNWIHNGTISAVCNFDEADKEGWQTDHSALV
jgi:hypothetical protein